MRFPLAACVLALTAACGPPPPPPPLPGECHLAVGTAGAGGVGFEAMPAPVTLTPGAQGGFHVWLNYRVQGAEPGRVTASHTVRRASDGKLLSRGERTLEVGANGDDGWWQSDEATPAFLCPTPLGVSVIGESAVIEVTLTAGGETLATEKVTTQLQCPTDAQADFCQRICAG